MIMRKYIIAAALLVVALPAFAAEVTGSVKAIETKTSTVMLDNGSSYVLDKKAKFEAEKLKVGEKVTITFEVKDGKNQATAISTKG
jgi:ABC-type glycerol-3-phosphate transport system substrate-binding protein